MIALLADTQLFPRSASDMASRVDTLFWVLCGLSAFIVIGVTTLIFYFGIKYRRGSNADRSHPPEGSNALEITWIVIPAFISIGLFVWGAIPYWSMYTPPANALQVNVVAKQWMFKFQHMEGPREINDLHIPLGRPIKLVMTSQDVVHSFFVPDFRIKRDILPARYTSVWFTPTRIGVYHLFCSQYCGTDHAVMRGHVFVMDPAAYQQWLAGAPPSLGPVASGRELFVQNRCVVCHQSDGRGVGPPLEGVAGGTVKLATGLTVVADDNYLRDSILYPSAQIVNGYPNVMPSFQGQLTDQDLLNLVAYLKSLAPLRPTGGVDGHGNRPAAGELPQPRP